MHRALVRAGLGRLAARQDYTEPREGLHPDLRRRLQAVAASWLDRQDTVRSGDSKHGHALENIDILHPSRAA